METLARKQAGVAPVVERQNLARVELASFPDPAQLVTKSWAGPGNEARVELYESKQRLYILS